MCYESKYASYDYEQCFGGLEQLLLNCCYCVCELVKTMGKVESLTL